MKCPALVLPFGSLLFLALVLSGCYPPGPQTVQVAIEVTAMTEQPFPQPFATPDLSAQLSCVMDSDCVLAYRTDQCCACGAIYNVQTVAMDRHLRLVEEPPGYRYPKWRYPQKTCPQVMCAPCPMPPFGLICETNICREAQTWQEIWSACKGLEPDQKRWCHVHAAIIAYQAGEEEQAATICNGQEGSEYSEIPDAEDCLLQVARSAMKEDPHATASFCQAHLTVLLSNCLSETGFAIGRTDVEAALALCQEIAVTLESDRMQKNICFHNVAMSVAKVDLVRAQQICELMSQDIEQCKRDAQNPQGVP